MFDFVVVDFPDPTNYSLGKLYTTAFYRLLAKHVSASGFDRGAEHIAVVCAASRTGASSNTLKQAGLQTWPYHVYVPSFGEWGFVLAGARARTNLPRRLPDGLRFLAVAEVPELFRFPTDMLPVDAEPNRLNDQVLVRYYEHEWKDIAH